MGTEFRVLGPVQASVAGEPVPLAGKPLTVLAGLLLRANTVVPVGVIEHWLWAEGRPAPRDAKAAIQTHMMRLRHALGATAVRTVRGGYRIDADETSLDLLRFEALAARCAALADDPRAADEAGTAALAQWRGDALTGVDSDALHRDEAAVLAERRLDVWQDVIDARLALGSPPIAELHRLVRENPLRERFAEQLVLALYRDGRQSDALAAYRRAAAAIAEDTGLEPGPGLRELQRAVLAADPALDLRAAASPGWAPPRQLPLDVAGFTGRAAELAELAGCAGGIVAVEGTAGVGKTALTIHFGHSAACGFPDGQVYVNLRGYGPGEPRDELSSLEFLLQAAGVGPDRIPADATARAALWRTVTAGRRLLVVLDNALSTEQVGPLLPGPGGLVLVTSRVELRGLVAVHGARRLSLGRLGAEDARALLATVVGAAAVAGDPCGGATFLRRCANLPLAVRILGERASRQPELSLGEFVARRDPDGLARFDLGDGADTDLRSVFAPSYRALGAAAARLFRLLGAHPGPAFGAELAAALLGVPDAEGVLAELLRAHLLERPAPGRYEFHDLLREYATELVRAAGEHDRAGRRIADWYFACALSGRAWINPEHGAGELRGVGELSFAEHDAAVRWFDTEWANLVALIHAAAATGEHARTWQLTRALQPYLGRNHRGQFEDWRVTHELGLAAARALGDDVAAGTMLNSLGSRATYLRRYPEAIGFFEQRLAIARRHGDLAGEQASLTNLGIAYDKIGEHRAALEAVTRSAELARQLGRQRSRSLALANLAEILIGLRRFDEAVGHAQLAYELHASGETLHVLGMAHAGAGDLAAGLGYLRKAVATHRDNGERNAMAEAAVQLAEVHRALDDVPAAAAALGIALTEFERLGHPDAEGTRARLARLR